MKTPAEYAMTIAGSILAAVLLAAACMFLTMWKHEKDRKDEEGL